MGLTIGGILGALVAGWIGGRVHLRANQLRALDKALGRPDGYLEARANEASEKAATSVGDAVGAAIDKRTGGL